MEKIIKGIDPQHKSTWFKSKETKYSYTIYTKIDDQWYKHYTYGPNNEYYPIELSELPEDVKEQYIKYVPDWQIYIEDEGHWPIDYKGLDYEEARRIYLKWANRKKLPKGSYIQDLANPRN